MSLFQMIMMETRIFYPPIVMRTVVADCRKTTAASNSISRKASYEYYRSKSQRSITPSIKMKPTDVACGSVASSDLIWTVSATTRTIGGLRDLLKNGHLTMRRFKGRTVQAASSSEYKFFCLMSCIDVSRGTKPNNSNTKKKEYSPRAVHSPDIAHILHWYRKSFIYLVLPWPSTIHACLCP